MNIREKILSVLEENGIFFDWKSEDRDSDMREYITDSLQFMSFIVELEKELDIEFPDEALVYDNLASLNGFIILVQSIIDGSYNTGTENDNTRKEEVYESGRNEFSQEK
jgi:acyl carrier protein